MFEGPEKQSKNEPLGDRGMSFLLDGTQHAPKEPLELIPRVKYQRHQRLISKKVNKMKFSGSARTANLLVRNNVLHHRIQDTLDDAFFFLCVPFDLEYFVMQQVTCSLTSAAHNLTRSVASEAAIVAVMAGVAMYYTSINTINSCLSKRFEQIRNEPVKSCELDAGSFSNCSQALIQSIYIPLFSRVCLLPLPSVYHSVSCL